MTVTAGKAASSFFHGNQERFEAGIRDSGLGIRAIADLLQAIEVDRFLQRELAAPRPPERLEAGARADALAEVTDERLARRNRRNR